MTKAQFLAFSLPFGLFCQVLDKGNDPKFVKLSAVYNDGSCSFFDTVESDHGFESVKPLLRPLSDLTKEIDHNGEKFVPIDKILEEACFDLSKMNRDEINSYSNPILMPELISLTDALMLIEWHFDLAGLIERDEAININNLVRFHY